MAATRANVEQAKAEFFKRVGNPYRYGEMWSRTDLSQGTDCSGLWNDVLGFATGHMVWGRESEGATTESYRYVPVGGVGPFGTIRVARPQDIPPNAVAKLAFHHEGNGGAASHMWGELDGVRMESAGSKGCVTAPQAWEITNPYANAWAYLPGPIIEDGTAATPVPEPKDTLFADVSEWQVPVDDSYPYLVLSIRANDGTYRDKKFAQNYAWMRRALDSGRLRCGIVYFYWRPNWQAAVATLQDMVNANGGLHPRVALMIDVERGGNPAGDFSDALNATDDALSHWVGDPRRVIAYGNVGDLNSMWRNRREDQFIVAGYGSNPSFPGKIAHQYTDGRGWGGGLPEGCPPFGNCDMNSADGYTATQFAAALGITVTPPSTGGDDLTPEQDRLLRDCQLQLLGPNGKGWPQLGNRTLVDALAVLGFQRVRSTSIYRDPPNPDGTEPESNMWEPRQLPINDDGFDHEDLVEKRASKGDLYELDRIVRLAAGAGAVREQWAIDYAQSVLADIERTNPEALKRYAAWKGTAA
ncbi:endolysin [Mycobacterium phage Mendokysei]|uniref:Lysin A n=1 Tax=Mycobacterium phage Mendokysei TaxID=2099637 RepID=A0A2P1CG82_9CAUD|nr:endolysin [Mycobacterium phage Mendokysei]AVJ50243.1 lysin A [Mycobacterium phage Mendokysei]